MPSYLPAKDLQPDMLVIPGPGTRAYAVESVRRERQGRFTLEIIIRGKETWQFAVRAAMTGHPTHVIFGKAFEIARDQAATLAAQWIVEQSDQEKGPES